MLRSLLNRARAHVALLAGLALASPAAADDGWATGLEQAGGVIYAREDHPQIALADEVLFLDDDLSVEAHFWFRNTSDKPVEVPAAFPLDFTFDFAWEGGALEGSYDALALAAILAKDGKDFEGSKDTSLLRVGKLPTSKRMSIAELRRRDRSELRLLPVPEITQDGKAVPLGEAVVSLKEQGKVNAPKTSRNRRALLRFDFQHKLAFAPGATSVVVVRYPAEVHTSSTNGGMEDTYGFQYVLGTGATWKGPIGTLWVAVPDWLVPQRPAALERMGHWGNKALYLARDWEPAASDRIRLDLELSTRGNPDDSSWDVKTLVHPTRPQPDGMAVAVAASSSLRGSTEVNPTSPSGKWRLGERAADFKPASLTDGSVETAWCEGAKGHGEGEWVELELRAAASAIEIVSGFLKLTPVAGAPPTFAANGRARKLALTRPDGTLVQELTLEDTHRRQSFEVALAPGKYRLVLKQVRPGAKYPDTCVGEVSFRPAHAALSAVMGAARPAREPLDLVY